MQYIYKAILCFFTIFLFSLIFTVQSVDAQNLGRVEQLRDQMPNHYSFVRTGEQSLRVVVLGTVNRPGSYEIRPGTDLNTLFLYAGGPSQVGTRSRNRTPEVNIFLSRPQEGGRRIIYSTTFSAYINQDVDFPEMQDLDMVIVETDPVPEAIWRVVLQVGSQILSVISSLLVILWRLGYLDRR
ncbi:MAG: SLBB domain-containing protein [Balneolales bacterium]|nr:SLBB domain-containing protein [Balneolales bacterium]